MSMWAGTGYDNDSYLQSLDQSSQDVKRQIQNALQEINRQKQVGQRQSGMIPGATKRVYDGARAQLGGDLSSLGLDMSRAVRGAFTGGAAAYGRASGLLGQGFQEQESQRAGATNTLQQSLLADILGKGNEHIAGRRSEDRNRAFQEQESARQNALQRSIQDQQARMQAQYLAAQAREAALNRAPAPQPGRPGMQSGRDLGAYPAAEIGKMVRAYDEGLINATQAYGPAGAEHYLLNNQRPGGYTPEQQKLLDNARRRSVMMSKDRR